MESFWKKLDVLVQSSLLVIDRPKGSTHPRYPAWSYPLDYGYLAGTTSTDGHGLDAWRGSLPEPFLDAVLCTVDLFKKDIELKLLLGCTEAEKSIIHALHNENPNMAAVMFRRDSDNP